MSMFYEDFERADHKSRALAYGKVMEMLYRRHPDDPEAAAFYALHCRLPPISTIRLTRSRSKAVRSSRNCFPATQSSRRCALSDPCV